MKYIFFTFSGLGYPIAQQLQREGKEVTVGLIEDIKGYVMEEDVAKAHESADQKTRRMNLFKGMVDIQPAEKVVEMMSKIKNPHEYFVFFEENNLYRWADKVKDMGFEGNFPTKEDYTYEIDRQKAKKFVSEHYKLHTPEVVRFDSIPAAEKFLAKTNEIWVLKGNADEAKAFVPDVTDVDLAKKQILEILENFPEKYEKMGFILELMIPSIIELTPEKMYYDGVPILTTIDIENKPFGAGNLSIQTGCAADMVFAIEMESRINKLAFPPIIDEMARQHKGLFIWDASLLIDKRDGKIYFGEFCSNRPGYNTLFTELALSPSIDEFFINVVHKNCPIPLGTVGTSLRVFNMNRDEETEKISSDLTVHCKSNVEKDIWLWDVMKNKRGQIVTVGYDWNLAVVTGSGKSINEAVNQMYRNVDNLSFVGSYYRSKDDYLSLDYSTSIINRLNYGLDRGLYQLPFNVKVGDIK